jgi:hypothetical protein
MDTSTGFIPKMEVAIIRDSNGAQVCKDFAMSRDAESVSCRFLVEPLRAVEYARCGVTQNVISECDGAYLYPNDCPIQIND